jgi:hypothetical protein
MSPMSPRNDCDLSVGRNSRVSRVTNQLLIVSHKGHLLVSRLEVVAH